MMMMVMMMVWCVYRVCIVVYVSCVADRWVQMFVEGLAEDLYFLISLTWSHSVELDEYERGSGE